MTCITVYDLPINEGKPPTLLHSYLSYFSCFCIKNGGENNLLILASSQGFRHEQQRWRLPSVFIKWLSATKGLCLIFFLIYNVQHNTKHSRHSKDLRFIYLNWSYLRQRFLITLRSWPSLKNIRYLMISNNFNLDSVNPKNNER